ncbi:MAG: penicillin acylase family protein, partial [Gemmatimonadetes bacterium]|nr:penicillin acylase family protein [Gemmatimonadota bacterium]
MLSPSRIGAAILLGGLVYASGWPLGPLPPLGSFLDPAGGVWAVARRAELPRQARGAIPGLEGPVEVVYDDRAVPHIFAATVNDAYRALGYVVARDRLFQLELRARATAGTLTELLGSSVLDLDRQQRGIGLARSGDRSFAALPAGSPAALAMTAYADGVNAWIAGMSRADLPLEYHLLSAWPIRWEPRYAVYALRRMGWTLAFQRDELRRQRVAALVGPDAAAALFPIHSPIQDPIQPGPGRYPRFDWKRLPPPKLNSQAARLKDGRPSDRLTIGGEGDGRDGVGSNSWAVAPSRSATGHALLAGDPHLDLTLPSVWYEAHLVVAARRETRDGGRGGMPDSSRVPRPPSLDVYGVAVPGAPGIVIGFNRDVAWSFTNTEADVLDYYAEKLDDPARPTRYLV